MWYSNTMLRTGSNPPDINQFSSETGKLLERYEQASVRFTCLIARVVYNSSWELILGEPYHQHIHCIYSSLRHYNWISLLKGWSHVCLCLLHMSRQNNSLYQSGCCHLNIKTFIFPQNFISTLVTFLWREINAKIGLSCIVSYKNRYILKPSVCNIRYIKNHGSF